MRLARRRLRSLGAGAASVALLFLLWTHRPAWPQLPSSLSAPVTTVTFEEIALLAAWLLAGILVIALVLQCVRGMHANRRVVLSEITPTMRTPTSHPPRRTLPAPPPLRSLAGEPKLVVTSPRDITASAPAQPVLERTTEPAAYPIPEADDRPLISLLGPLMIEGARRSRRGLRVRALELIAFLALRREGAQRDEILEALWPGDDPERSRHRLYQAVRDARRLLGDAVASERDRYWLDRNRVRIDVDDFERRLAEADGMPGGQRERLLEAAVELVRGEPLAGTDYAWADGHVRHLCGVITDSLERLGYLRLDEGDPAAALAAAERGIAIDGLNERLYRLAMRAEGALGLRQAIVERYEQLSRRLDHQLGLEPERETRALYLELLSQG